MSWASEELQGAELGDVRRNRRLVKIVEDLSAQPTASVTQAARDEAAVQGTYEFWSNPHVKPEAIMAASRESVMSRVKQQEMVLAIQDTTELDFSQHRSKRGMGSLSNPAAKGLKVHSTLCVSPSGVPLGVVEHKVWAREPNRRSPGYQRRKEAIEQKESQRWLDALVRTTELIPSQIKVVTVGDREADIYRLFAKARRENSEFLIRATHNRVVKASAQQQEVGALFESIRGAAVAGQLTLELQRTPKHPAREATLEVRFAPLWLQVPVGIPQREGLRPLKVQVILASEENPPAGEKAISWLLLTTLPVEDFEQACQCLEWYSKRWLIERYHFVLKSGCRLEELQLEAADRIERALATYSIVAWRLLWLTYQARVQPDQPADQVLETHEWQALYCHTQKTTLLPEKVPTIRECVGWIARLGGFLGRKRDGNPGVVTLWRGIQRLHDLAAMWQLLTAGVQLE